MLHPVLVVRDILGSATFACACASSLVSSCTDTDKPLYITLEMSRKQLPIGILAAEA